MEKLGIDSLIPVIDVVIEGGNISGKIAAIPKEAALTEKLAPLLGIYDELMGLTKVNWNQVVPQLKDLDETELLTIQNHFIEKFDLPQDEVEIIVEEALLLVKKNISVVMQDILFAKKLLALKNQPKE